MAFKKGFCTHCKGDERSRIFEVNKDAEVCYCPHCTHAMTPKEAMNNFTWLISSYLKKASKALFESTEYLYAYQLFAHVIDLDETAKVNMIPFIVTNNIKDFANSNTAPITPKDLYKLIEATEIDS